MLPNKHALYGILFSLSLFSFFPSIGFLGIILIFLSSVFIDVDHYFASILSGNGFSLQKAYKWMLAKNKNKYEYVSKWIIPFHGIELFIVLFSLYFLNDGIIANILIYIIIGCLFHLFLDIIDLFKHKLPWYLKLSCLYTYYIHYKLLKSKTKTFK
jgi:uncharacterized membrane protein